MFRGIKKLGAMELGQLTALVILYISIISAVVYLIADGSAVSVIIAVLIAWQAWKNKHIFEFEVVCEKEQEDEVKD